MADARAPASAAPPGLPAGQIDERTVHRLRDGTSYISTGMPGADNPSAYLAYRDVSRFEPSESTEKKERDSSPRLASPRPVIK